jgi:hypothetical protein
MANMPFTVSVGGHKYNVFGVMQADFSGIRVLKGVDMYTLTGVYKGFWPVYNMPQELIEQTIKFCERNEGQMVFVESVKTRKRPSDFEPPITSEERVRNVRRKHR